MPPIPITGIATRAATAWTCCSAIARTAGPETPPVVPPSHGPPPPGSSAMPLSVLISETASAPASWAAAATASGSLAFGVSLTISGRSESVRTRSTALAVSAGSAPITSPVSTFGQETLSSIIDTSVRSPTAATSSASSSRLKPITETTSGTGSSASWGRSSARKPASPLFGRPIELIRPAGVSHRRGGGFPCRGATVIVFETNASNGKRSSRVSPKARRAAIASKVPEPFRTGPRSGTPQSSMSRPGLSGRLPGTARSRGGRRRAPGRPRTGAGSPPASGRRSRSTRRSRRPCRIRARVRPGPRAPRRAP